MSLDWPALRGQCGTARLSERERETAEHRQVGVESDTFDATDTQDCEAVGVFQVSELALHSGATAVDGAPRVATARDAAVTLTLVLSERNDGGYASLGALSIDPIVVVAHIERSGCGHEAASGPSGPN